MWRAATSRELQERATPPASARPSERDQLRRSGGTAAEGGDYEALNSSPTSFFITYTKRHQICYQASDTAGTPHQPRRALVSRVPNWAICTRELCDKGNDQHRVGVIRAKNADQVAGRWRTERVCGVKTGPGHRCRESERHRVRSRRRRSNDANVAV